MSSPRVFALASCCVLAVAPIGALAAPSTARTPQGRPTAAPALVRKIVISINGDTLKTETPPIVIDNRLYVPLRVVFDALGIDVVRRGREISGDLPAGNVKIVVGSRVGTIDDRPVTFDVPVIDTKGTTYASLNVVRAVLGAEISFDQKAALVTIVSGAVGRAPSGESAAAHGGTSVQGVVSEVDAASVPPTISIVSAGEPRTISVTSGVKIFIEDVTIHTQVVATLADVRIGDALRATLTKSGDLVDVHDFFKSTSGTISAVSQSAFVLASGRVIAPTKTSSITVNDVSAGLGDLHVGDFVTVRSNPETGELRQVIASRSGVAVAPSAPAGTVPATSGAPVPTISGVTLGRTRPLHAGESLTVTLAGTPGGHAEFDIGDFVTGIDMLETTAGTYVGHFEIPARFNAADIPVYGHLSVSGVNAPKATAAGAFSAATTPPQVSDVAPPSGETVNSARPSIYATFATPSEVGIDVASAQIVVNGHDVTSSSARTNGFIAYTPGVDYGEGPVTVVVHVADLAGNVATRTWTFTIHSR